MTQTLLATMILTTKDIILNCVNPFFCLAVVSASKIEFVQFVLRVKNKLCAVHDDVELEILTLALRCH